VYPHVRFFWFAKSAAVLQRNREKSNLVIYLGLKIRPQFSYD
jgi:hypothetical protein